MLGHGGGLRAKPSRYGGFQCVVCSSVVNVGDAVVGYRNVNKGGAKGWDHVHAEGCADRYVSPPLRSAAPVEPQNTNNSLRAIVPTAPSSSAQPETPEEEPSFIATAMKCSMSRDEALAFLSAHSGDDRGALAALALREQTAFETTVCQPCGGGGVEEAAFDPAGALDSEDELPPEPPHVARFSSDAARLALVEVFYRFVRPLLPKPQTDGGFKDGDPELLHMLMPTPVTLALPRAAGLVRSSLNRTGLLRSRLGHPDACTGPEPLAARSDPTTPQRGRASRDVEEAFEAGAVGRAHSARAAARSRRSGADENASPVRVPPRHG